MLNNESLIVVLTRECYPCSCVYCNVFKKDFYNFWDNAYKDIEYFYFIVDKIISFVEKTNIDSIRFFGGEPLLKKKVLFDILSYMRKKGFKKDIYINTNLHLFEKEDIFLIKRYNTKIITSLNGFINLHCKTRGINRVEYKKLIENIKNLINNKIYLQINVVLFPFEKTYIKKVKYILSLGPAKVNLLPLMYSHMVNEQNIEEFLNKIERLLKWIKANKLQNKILNFTLLNKKKKSFVPLVTDEIVIDSDGCVYKGMIALESFFQKYKDIIYLTNVDNLDYKTVENDYLFSKIKTTLITKLANDSSLIKNSFFVSNVLSDLLYKYK